jgi:hypothetical protein
MERALRRARLTLTDRVEAHLRWANATLEMREWGEAEHQFREVLRINRDAAIDREQESLPPFHPIVVQAHWGLGRAYHEIFLEIKLVLPQEEIHGALVDKAQLLDQARSAYLEVVRSGHPYWSPAAGFMIGQIYEDFYLDVLACEVPQQFDEITLEVYFEELREYLEPVLERALRIYQDNLAMAERMGSDNVWVEETQFGIERLQRMRDDPNLRREQELMILEQLHPHSARDPRRRWAGPDQPGS